ncbi:NAD(P)/FAD-dependent oxidoreductase [Streptosporangium sp. NBC_01755]|uniref:NAD(P)/FAD-dependent oxidoreductase n=1 Tax=unclassified Streptosporangium TaxID=2632669 RepID=UPI002DD837FE|nr:MULTISPECIES: NAD(P)/FAD-dependent oxidoreductase [unclassified Streptosporangium]WSA28608.1 NAD(P)/FAD-dependent oxidoreductase [Streptosporangium sp. NBC_01810]WSC99931.1 NAD(P)/FAD-dependent oxidoreductase [Streptosporangium sp. NBC_01755]
MRWPPELSETPDPQGAYPRLSDAQLQALAPHGERRRVRRDEVLYAEGLPCTEFFAVLAGKMVLDNVATGGQAGTSSRIENYLGFPSGISGGELAERAAIQAGKFGARFCVPAQACGLRLDAGDHIVTVGEGGTIHARTLIVATGVRYRRLDVQNLERFEPTSVYYAATMFEAQMCKRDPIVVVGGGNSAGQAAFFLARHAARVRLLVREDALSRNMSRYLAVEIERHSQIQIMLNTEARELMGEERLAAVIAENNVTGERSTIEARAMFIFIGAAPYTAWLANEIALDPRGYILTGADATRSGKEGTPDSADRPFPLETSRAGVFAAGDVRSGSIKRVAAAVGEGAMAVRLIHDYLQAGQ